MGARRPNANLTTSEPIQILILEDVASDAELITMELDRAGIPYAAARASDRESFLRSIAEQRPHAILADYSLPGFTAIDALQHLRSHGLDPCFILVTGTQSEDIAVSCIKAGADDYILKQSLVRLPTALLNAIEKKNASRTRDAAERALRESEERFRLIFARSPLPTLVCDLNTKAFLEVNQAASQQYGYTRQEFLQLHLRDIVASNNSNIEGRKQHRTKDGRIVDAQVVAETLEFEGRKAALVIAEDITDRLQAERQLETSREQLRALSARLQKVREEERTRIAREVHDELGQALTALRFDLMWTEGKLSGLDSEMIPKVIETIHTMTGIIDTTIQTVRRIATDLRPGVLDDLGLVSAIEWQAQEFHQRTGIRCKFTSTIAEIELDRERSTAMFRILQETLTNVARHAQAANVVIRLERTQSNLLMEITDDGKGITDKEVNESHSLGILGMRERALLLGGDVVIKGARNIGTMVLVRLPLPPVQGEERQQ